MPYLTINGAKVSWPASDTIEQSYSPIGGIATMRFANGTALRQTAWRKLATTISASGWIPPALAGVDWDAPVTLGCVAPRGIRTTGLAATLPASRRTDEAVFAYAAMPSGVMVSTAVSLVGNVATVTAVLGAEWYEVTYYPLLTVLSNGPDERRDANGAVSSWELVAEEV